VWWLVGLSSLAYLNPITSRWWESISDRIYYIKYEILLQSYLPNWDSLHHV